MLKALLLASALAVSAPAWAADTSSGTAAQDPNAQPLSPEERDQALRELQELRSRINRLENRLGVPSEPPPPAPPMAAPQVNVAPPPPPGPKNHNLEVY